MTDFYQTLGVPKSADQEEIKKAYRKLAAQHHPDRGGDTAQFQRIQEAYSTLSDPQKKSQYDNPPQHFFHQGGMDINIDDIFSNFMNFGHPFQGFQRGQQKNRNINIQARITLNDAFHGKEIVASFNLPNGRPQTVNIKIPAGIQENTTLRVHGLGDDSIPHLPKGDVFLTVIIDPHPVFQRQNDDLVCPLEIDCIEAMLGCKKYVTTIEGKTLEININPGVQFGQTLNATGHGMPNMRDSRYRGNLLIPLQITIPVNLNSKQINLLHQFKS